MVGSFPMLEDEMCLWVPGDKSPNRMDAKVWADTELMGSGSWVLGPAR
jgi:phage terminase large subunit-like protein